MNSLKPLTVQPDRKPRLNSVLSAKLFRRGNSLSPVFSQKKYKHEIVRFSFDEISELAVFLNTCLDLTEDEAKSGLILPLSKSSYVEILDCNNITDCIVYTIGDERELSKDEALLLQKTILEVREFLDECSKQ